MQKLSDADIEKIYQLIAAKHKAHLANEGIKLPKLRNKDGSYVKDALVLVKLAENYPDTKPISKQDLTAFMGLYYHDITDVWQTRHLGAQKALILSLACGAGLCGNHHEKSDRITFPCSSLPLLCVLSLL